MDVLAVEAAAKTAVEFIRGGGGAYFLECKTYRFRAHSMFDPELYRDKAEVEEWKKHGPVVTLSTKLKELELLQDQDCEAIERDVAEEVERAVAFADAGSLEPVEDLTRFVYSDREPA
jgi:TPP-dependent pyruvate/acetoin dehydrogenase alpha subunit